ncbi:hypothetical protein [Methylorubrum extorquens]|uniref:Uncharacterized protein n=1 Tax=Methylorubrum extorquens (strain ATCC 14718 / DSM 1338 / JCM 2805 / NCIMB 9133 / AM1) TaxID=272630 RepID=C5B3D6_METEA|nr:hypothetical protein [Methylorubrum extorquens]ACS42968.1 conserved hypothetical protein [Methylorubrum extorquens AM1]MCP1545994.1 hypothetical protein [Methylorubrum extorquens]MCP1590661.1 hypothetical protein [Methylorubrum extorquens]
MRYMMLGLEVAGAMVDVHQVVALRLLALSLGGAAAGAEAQLMVAEKVEAAFDAGLLVAAGGSPEQVVELYRGKVRANLERLSSRG